MVPRRAIVIGCAALALNAMARDARGSENPKPIKIVALGDSLTAGYRLKPSDAFPAQLQAALAASGQVVEVVNAGVSGDTASAALQRLDWALQPGTDAVVVELGGNDALRGVDPARTRAAVDEIVGRLRAKGLPVLLAGMKAPRNLGTEYAEQFDAIYPDIAKKHDALLYPFFLDGVLLDPKLMLEDGLHPNAAGVAAIVRNILPSVVQLIGRVPRARS
jgi:acyl-CoA thioesterase-1